MQRDIAIVGAGIGGLAAALFLRRDGHRVTLFERFAAPRPIGSGLMLQPTGQAVLDRLGLFGRAAALGRRIDRLDGRDRSGRRVLDVSYAPLGPHVHGIGIHRHALFTTLHVAVERAGIALETGWEVAGLDRGADGRVALLRADGRRSARFDLAVCAAGAHCPLLDEVHARPRELPFGAVWGTVPWRAGFAENALSQRYERAHTMVGVLPIGRSVENGPQQAAFFWSLKPRDYPALRRRGLDAWKSDVRRVWPETEGHLASIASFDDLVLARYGHHTQARPHAGRLVFIGDAAHSTSPQLGQGANMALLDAAALATAMRERGVEGAPARYAALRRWHVRAFQVMSWALTPFYQSDSRLLPLLRDRVMPHLFRVPPAPWLLAHIVSGTLLDPLGRLPALARSGAVASPEAAR